MDQESQFDAVKNLIMTGNLHEFRQIFLYVKKTAVFERVGGNYGTFLKHISSPKHFKFGEVYAFANIFNVPPLEISKLIHAQIDNAKAATPKKKKSS